MSPIIGTRRLAALGSMLRSLAGRLGGAPVPAAAGDRRVAWIADAEPRGEEAEAIYEAIAGLGLRRYEDVARYTADRLYRTDQARGGWVASIGLFYPWYLAHARDALERLRGAAVAIDEEARPWR